jgi:hypothetical protein
MLLPVTSSAAISSSLDAYCDRRRGSYGFGAVRQQPLGQAS